MKTLKAILHWLSLSVLSLAVFSFIGLLAVSVTLRDPENVKSWLVKSEVYEQVTGQLLNAVSHGEESPVTKLLKSEKYDQERLQNVFEQVYPSEHWQAGTEAVIDGIYGWLDGSSGAPEFSVNLLADNQELAKKLETEINLQLADLPKCAAGAEFSVAEATCRPTGPNAGRVVRNFSNSVAENLTPAEGDLVISGDDLKLSDEAITTVPEAYSRSANLPWLAVIVLGVLSAAVIVSAKGPLFGVRRVGLALFIAGLLSWLGYYSIKWLATDSEINPETVGETEAELVRELAVPFGREAMAGVATTGLWLSLITILAGTAIWLGAFYWHKMHHQPDVSAKKPENKDHTLPPPVAKKS